MFGMSKLAHEKHFDCSFKCYSVLNLLINRTFVCNEVKPDKAFSQIGVSQGFDIKLKEQR